MLPETVHTCKPTYRKLQPRSFEEKALFEKLVAKKEKKRKSLSQQPSKVNKRDPLGATGKQRGRPKGKKTVKNDDDKDGGDEGSVGKVDDNEIACINEML